MTKAQKDRLQELEEQATADYLSDTDFDVADYLDEKEGIEFCKLYNMQFAKAAKCCRCGTHTKWQ